MFLVVSSSLARLLTEALFLNISALSTSLTLLHDNAPILLSYLRDITSPF